MQKTKKEWGVYKIEVPDVKKTNAEANGSGGGGGGGVGNNCGSGGGRQSMSCDDGIVINLNNGRTIGGDIKVECSASHVLGKKKLFSFWFNTHFVWDKQDDGECSGAWPILNSHRQLNYFSVPFCLQKPTTTIHL